MKKVTVIMQDGEDHVFKNAQADVDGKKLMILELDKKTGIPSRRIAEFDRYDVKNWWEEEVQE